MKNLLIGVFCLFFTKLSAQVYEGQNMYGGKNSLSYFMFSNQDEKDVQRDLEEFLKNYGKVTKPQKSVFRIEKIKTEELPADVDAVEAVFETNKKVLKLTFFFQDKNQQILNNLEFKENEAKSFVARFQKFTLANLEAKLAFENVKIAEANLLDTKKDQIKIEKSLENNLKDQEKLGKKLDSTPEMLTKALSEKEEIVGSLYSENETEVDKKAKEELEKASTKKEKEIQKIQKDKEKAETKLSKKEAEFDSLKNELFKTKSLIKALEAVLKDAQSVVDVLKLKD